MSVKDLGGVIFDVHLSHEWLKYGRKTRFLCHTPQTVCQRIKNACNRYIHCKNTVYALLLSMKYIRSE